MNAAFSEGVATHGPPPTIGEWPHPRATRSPAAKQLWLLEVRRDVEASPAIFRVTARCPDRAGMSEAGEGFDEQTVRELLTAVHPEAISVRGMFGGVGKVAAGEAVKLLLSEDGARMLASLWATRSELRSSLARLR